MGDLEATAAGQDFRGYRRGGTAGDPVDQYVVPVQDRIVSYRGRAGTFRIPGRAGTTGQKLFSIHNATGSTVLVDVEQIASPHDPAAHPSCTPEPARSSSRAPRPGPQPGAPASRSTCAAPPACSRHR